MNKALLTIAILCAVATDAQAQLHVAAYGGLAIPAAANTSYTLNPGTAFGAQLLYEIPSVEGLSVGQHLTADEYREQLRQYFPTLKRWQKK